MADKFTVFGKIIVYFSDFTILEIEQSPTQIYLILIF